MKKLSLLILLFIQTGSYSQNSNVYEVYAIRFSKSWFVKLSEIAVGATDKDSVEGCNMFWLLKGNGKNILVDAGFLSKSKDFIKPDSALSAMNLKPEAITDIIITHPHYDHIGGIELFPSAQLWMQKDDYEYFVGDAWQKGNFNEGLNKQDVKTLVARNLEGKLNLVKGDSAEILPGIRAFIGSKHTWESQYILVETKTDKVVIASDNSWFYYNLIHLVSIPKYTFDATAYINQLKRMRQLQPDVNLIIPGHDASIFSKFPKVAEGIVRVR